MALRLMEAFLPEEAESRVDEILDGAGIILRVFTPMSDPPGIRASVLMEASATENVGDQLTDAFGSEEGFRIVLLPVEATLPTPEAEEESQDAPAAPRISREELWEDVSQEAALTPIYLVMVALSTVVAAVGLIRGDVAIVIGAMVIAPLLGPNIALSLSATLGDLELGKRALRTIAAGIVTAAIVAVLTGLVLPVDSTGPEIARRTGVGLGDILLGLGAGAAGALAFTTGVPAAVVGVMVAVALLPPLVVAGLMFGAGETTAAYGAGALLLTNVTCVNLAAIATFLAQKIGPRTWVEADRARKATRIAVACWIVLLGILVTVVLLGWVEGVGSGPGTP